MMVSRPRNNTSVNLLLCFKIDLEVRFMNHTLSRLGGALAIALLAPVSTFGQGCKGAFIDGECVENYVYVPDFMPPEELKKAIDQHSPNIVIVDTAAPAIWEDEHIPGAVNFPYSKDIKAP